MIISDLIGGGSSNFVAESMGFISVPVSTAAGDIITITPPSGKRVVIYSLLGNSNGGTNVTIPGGALKFGTRTVLSGTTVKSLAVPTSAASTDVTIGAAPWARALQLVGNKDEAFKLTTTGATSGVALMCCYAIGE